MMSKDAQKKATIWRFLEQLTTSSKEWGRRFFFVTNSLSSDEADSTREFDRNVREKLVWKIYRFKPSPATLAKDILAVGSRPVDDVDVSDAIVAGAEASGCVNARAMIGPNTLFTNYAVS